ncbi:MAG: hypothetical protein MZV65_31920 [Chromatiales bacterium]|nr:hypothetical protein [Chromatiales bacterium]
MSAHYEFEIPLHAVIDINGYAYRHLGGGVFADNGHGHAPHFIPASVPADELAPPEPVQIDERANAHGRGAAPPDPDHDSGRSGRCVMRSRPIPMPLLKGGSNPGLLVVGQLGPVVALEASSRYWMDSW